MTRSLTWIGLSAASWNAASSWREGGDGSDGRTAAAAPEGSDVVSIVGGSAPLVVAGTGTAARASTWRSVLLAGVFRLGTLDVEGAVAVAGPDSRLTLGGLGQTGAAVASRIVVDAGAMLVHGGASLGELSVAGGGQARFVTTLSVSAGVSVDARSCLQVGGDGSGGWVSAGWLKIVAGGTLAGGGVVAAAHVLVDGTVLASGLRVEGVLGGSGQVRLDEAGVTVGAVLAGTRLVFAGAGACLTIAPGSLATMAGTLQGLAPGDLIDIQGLAVGSARFVATDAQGGIVSLADAIGGTLGTLRVATGAGAAAVPTFIVLPDGAGGTLLLDAAPAVRGVPSRGNPSGHRDVWAGGSGAAWNAAASWRDMTLGGAALIAPGPRDSVAITGGARPLVVTGSGYAGQAVVHRSVLLDGAFQFGTLDVDGTLTLAGGAGWLELGALGQAGAASASRIDIVGTTFVVVGRSALGVAGVRGHGWARLGPAVSVSVGLTVEPGSCLEIGRSFGFWPGWLAVHPDATLVGSGTVSADTFVQGSIVASGLRFGGRLAGPGQVRFDQDGVTLAGAAAGLRLVFAGAGACLTIAAGAAPDVRATLVGLSAGDAIDLQGQIAVSARVVATDPQHAALAITGRTGAVLEALVLDGPASAYAGAQFLAIPDGNGGTFVLDLPPASRALPGPGSGAPRRALWVGLSGAAWGTPSSWRDPQLGMAPSTAPGPLDAVSIVGRAIPLVVTGSGAAAAVATSRSVLLDGTFRFATLDVEGTLTLAGGGSALALGNLGQTGAAGPSRVVLASAELVVAGGSVLGSLSVSGGAAARMGHTVAVTAGLTADVTSFLEVGAARVFWPGWLGVLSDGTLSGSGEIAARTFVQGTIVSSGMRFDWMLAGAGRVVFDEAGVTVRAVLPGVRMQFAGPGARLTVDAGYARAMHGTLDGFAAGDAIDVRAEAVASARYSRTGPNSGSLVLADAQGASLASFDVTGPPEAYARASYSVLPDGAGGSLILHSGPSAAAALLMRPS